MKCVCVCVCVCEVAVCRVIWVFISAVYGVLYRSVCVGTCCIKLAFHIIS